MARILPAGANVNLNLGEDPMDRLVKTVDLAIKVGGAFQKGQDRRRTNSSNEMSDLMTMLTNGSQYLSGEDYQKIGNQIDIAADNARGIGTPTLTTQANLLEKVHESMSESNTDYENSLLTFNNDFMNTDIFNQANYTDADGNPNMVFLDEINAKGIDFFNETQRQLSNYQRQLFSVGSKGELIPKRNNQASRKAQADYQKAKNMFYNLYDSRLKNVISQEEFIYIANNGGLQNEVLDEHRKTVIDNTTSRLNSVERAITANSKVSNSLKIKKTDKLRIALKDIDGGIPAWMQGYLEADKEITEDELDTALELTPEDYEAGVLVGPDGQAEEIPDRIKRVYDELISQTDDMEMDLRGDYFDLKERFDYWSPFAWDSTGTVVDNSGKNLKYQDTEETPEAVEALFAQQSTEKALVTEEVTPVELKNQDDFAKLGINISGNLTKSNLERIENELMEIFNNTPDSNFVKIQHLKRASDAISNALGQTQSALEESVEQPALNEKQLKQAEPKFKKFQKQTENQIAGIKKDIEEKTIQMNQMTSFNKESLKKQKNIISEKIKVLENRLAEQQNLLKNTDMNTWLSTIAEKKMVEQIKTGKSNAELVQDYLNK